MLKKNWIIRLCVIIFIIGSISFGGEAESLGILVSGYAYGLIITVQVCSRINYKICHNQTVKEHLP